MKRHDGFALPTAVALCSVLLIVSIGVSSVLVVSSSLSRVRTVQSDNEIIFRKSTNTWISASGDHTSIIDDNFTWNTYDGESGLKALVAESANTIRFYAVYDFTNSDLLAYQSSNFYITTNGSGQHLLGGLVVYGGTSL